MNSDSELKGHERMVAEFERENAARNAARQSAAPAPVALSAGFTDSRNAPLTRLAATTAADRTPESEEAARSGTQLDQVQIPAKSLPTEFLLLPWGANASGAGTLNVDDTTAAKLVSNQQALGQSTIDAYLPRVMSSGDDGPQSMLLDKEVGCRGTVIVRPGEGIFLTDLEFTQEGMLGMLNYDSIVPFVWFDLASRSVLFVQSAEFGRLGASAQGRPWPSFVTLSAADLSRGISSREKMELQFRRDNQKHVIPLSAYSARPLRSTSAPPAPVPGQSQPDTGHRPSPSGARGRERLREVFERENGRKLL